MQVAPGYPRMDMSFNFFYRVESKKHAREAHSTLFLPKGPILCDEAVATSSYNDIR